MTSPADKKSDKSGDGQCLTDLINRRYGHRLTGPQSADLNRIIRGLTEMTDRLRSVELANSDEPLTRFIPFREDD